MLGRTFKSIYLGFVIVYFLLFFSSVFANTKVDNLRKSYKGPNAKYVFYFIGDGMGLSHINATEAYRAALEGKVGRKKLSFTDFSNVCLTSTHSLTVTLLIQQQQAQPYLQAIKRLQV
jgi:alkaline phosphatase